MVFNRIILNKTQQKELILKLRNTENICFISRDDSTGKNPYSFFLELGIDYSDAVNIVKNLSLTEYQYTQLDSKNKYTYMYVFNKIINGRTAYIKIGFKSDKTIVISFHEKMFNE